jgi:hypothetical protein
MRKANARARLFCSQRWTLSFSCRSKVDPKSTLRSIYSYASTRATIFARDTAYNRIDRLRNWIDSNRRSSVWQIDLRTPTFADVVSWRRRRRKTTTTTTRGSFILVSSIRTAEPDEDLINRSNQRAVTRVSHATSRTCQSQRVFLQHLSLVKNGSDILKDRLMMKYQTKHQRCW